MLGGIASVADPVPVLGQQLATVRYQNRAERIVARSRRLCSKIHSTGQKCTVARRDAHSAPAATVEVFTSRPYRLEITACLTGNWTPILGMVGG